MDNKQTRAREVYTVHTEVGNRRSPSEAAYALILKKYKAELSGRR